MPNWHGATTAGAERASGDLGQQPLTLKEPPAILYQRGKPVNRKGFEKPSGGSRAGGAAPAGRAAPAKGPGGPPGRKGDKTRKKAVSPPPAGRGIST